MGRPRWGLPTARCPASEYLLHELPRLHAERKAAGRVLYYCSNGGIGWGNFLQGLPLALVHARATQDACPHLAPCTLHSVHCSSHAP